MVNTFSSRIQLENHKSATSPVEQTNQQVLKQLKEKITMEERLRLKKFLSVAGKSL